MLSAVDPRAMRFHGILTLAPRHSHTPMPPAPPCQMLYLLPTTALTQQFWAVDAARTAEQLDVLGRFLQVPGERAGVGRGR